MADTRACHIGIRHNVRSFLNGFQRLVYNALGKYHIRFIRKIRSCMNHSFDNRLILRRYLCRQFLFDDCKGLFLNFHWFHACTSPYPALILLQKTIS